MSKKVTANKSCFTFHVLIQILLLLVAWEKQIGSNADKNQIFWRLKGKKSKID